MKIKDLFDLEEKIDNELAWRKKELTSIKVDVEFSEKKKRVNNLRLFAPELPCCMHIGRVLLNQ